LGASAKHGLCDECREARRRQRIEFLKRIAPWIGVGLVIAYGLLSQGAEEDNSLCDTSDDESLEPSDTASSLMDAPEDILGGQTLSKFDKIAQKRPEGLGCTIEEDKIIERTNEEKNLLGKLASGSLDGMVGNERVYSGYQDVYCGKYIKEGEPVSYRQGESTRFFNGEENERIPGKRTENHYDTDDRKLEFLQRYGWLIDDEEVRAYSAKFKPNK
jgi:hypothetical protein